MVELVGGFDQIGYDSKIVNNDGTPTEFFLKQLQRQKQLNGGVGDVNAALEAALDRITNLENRNLFAGVALSGGGNLLADRSFDLENTAVTPATYGDSTHIPQITIDQQGRITLAASVAAGAGASGSLEYTTGGLIASSNFTQTNFTGTTSVTDTAGASGAGAIVLKETANNNNVHRLLRRNVPTAPYRVTFQAYPLCSTTNSTASWLSLGWYDSGTGKFQSFTIRPAGTLGIDNWTNTTTFSATLVAAINNLNPRGQWYGLRDDNAGNVIFEISADGVTWEPFSTVSKAAGFLGATGYNQYFFGIEKNNGTNMQAIIRTIDETGASRGYP